ncbi:MAG: HAD family hydrolase [Coriobacteriales bacterium]
MDTKTLLFDLDGTLLNTYDIILASMRHTINGIAGKSYSDQELMSLVGTPLYDQMLALGGGGEERAEELTALYRQHNDAIHDENVRTYEGIPEALEELERRGYRMGIVTSKRHHMAVKGLEICGIRRFFQIVIGSDDWPEHKPQPGPVLHGAELMGVDARDCYYIGDSPFDVQAGGGAGCTTIAVSWGMFEAERLGGEQPDHLIAKPCELLDILA